MTDDDNSNRWQVWSFIENDIQQNTHDNFKTDIGFE